MLFFVCFWEALATLQGKLTPNSFMQVFIMFDIDVAKQRFSEDAVDLEITRVPHCLDEDIGRLVKLCKRIERGVAADKSDED